MNFFKRNLLRFGLLSLVSITLGSSVLTSAVPTAQAQTGNLFFGQKQAYSVMLRGNGEAVVYARINFTNTSDTAIKTFSLQIPDVNVSEFMALQSQAQTQSQPKPPIRCPYASTPQEQLDCPVDYYKITPPTYTINYQGYKKLTVTKTGDKYELQLEQEVQPQKNSTFVLAYVASGYVKKSLGVYKYSFQTPEFDSRIQNIDLSFSVDSGYFLKGDNSEINYAERNFTATLDSAIAESGKDSTTLASPLFNSVVDSIGTSGQLYKHAQNLAPNESFSVQGEYATNKWSMIWWEITWKILVGLAVLAGLAWAMRYWYKKQQAKIAEANPQPTENTQGNSIGSTNTTDDVFHLFHPFYSTVGISILAIIYAILYVIDVVQNSPIYYQNPNELMLMLGIIICAILILAIAILPPVLIGKRFGWKAGVSVVCNMFIGLVILWFILFVMNANGVPSISPQLHLYPPNPPMDFHISR